MSSADQDGACRVLVGLLESRTGQTLSPNRIWRIETALKPILRKHGIESLDALVGRLVGNDEPALANEVVDAMLNNESFFFRDHTVFDDINTSLLEDLRARNAATRAITIWSAGCSTGQEAYSLAMLFADAPHKWRDWSIRVVGTDISHSAVERARSGLYTQFEVQRGLSVTLMVRYFDQVAKGWQLKPEICRMVSFQQHNLLKDLPPQGPFDLVLCRNVLLYFSGPVRREAFDRIRTQMAPHGHLMLGAGETVLGQTAEFVASQQYRGLYSLPRPKSIAQAPSVGSTPAARIAAAR